MRPEDLDAIIEGRSEVTVSRPRRTVPILVDGDLREQIEAVQTELITLENRKAVAEAAAAEGRPSGRRVNSADGARIETLRTELEALAKLGEKATMYVVVEGLQSTDWLALVAKHPPEPNDEGKIVHVYNPETIKAPLAKACIIGHRERASTDAEIHPLSEEKVDWLLGWATGRQIDMLADAAYRCCQRDDAVPLDRVWALLSPTPGSVAA